ncbi:MAG: head-tail connector protein [Sulfuricella sp.]
MSASDLTTLANARQWLGLTSTNDDALLSRLITAASNYIQSWLNRSFASREYSETRDGAGGAKLPFTNYPVTAVASVTIDGQSIPLASGSQAPGYMFSATMLYLNGYSFARGRQNVNIAYTAGFAATPPEIEQACLELMAVRYKERDRIGQVSKSIGGETITFSQKDFPDPVRTILNNYKKDVPL